MTSVSKLRITAKKLIAEGRADFEKKSAPDHRTKVVAKNLRTGATTTQEVKLSMDRHEYWMVYEKARNLLLKHGYEKALDPSVQALYSKLIPNSAAFEDERKTSFKQIRSRNSESRLQAAKHFCKAALDESSRFRESWLKHPETIDILIEALRKEKDSKVARDLIIALGGVYGRYFRDLRIFPALFEFYNSADKTLQLTAVRWTRRCPNAEKWPRLIELMGASKTQPLLIASLSHVDTVIPVKTKRQLQPLLLQLWTKKLNDNSKRALLEAMIDTVDKRTVASFHDEIEHNKRLKKSLAKWVESSTSGARRDFLRSELLA